ncbi:MAG: hypothetical protein WC812_01160 [Candidatus Pacearchaeota archaeon]|jgi:hypothetical protein
MTKDRVRKKYQFLVENLISHDDPLQYLHNKPSELNYTIEKMINLSRNLEFVYPKERMTEQWEEIKNKIIKKLEKRNKEDVTIKEIDSPDYICLRGDKKRYILYYGIKVYEKNPKRKPVALICFNNKELCKNLENNLN